MSDPNHSISLAASIPRNRLNSYYNYFRFWVIWTIHKKR